MKNTRWHPSAGCVIVSAPEPGPTMSASAIAAVLAALTGMPLILQAARRLGLGDFDPRTRLALWGLAAVVAWLAGSGGPGTTARLGLASAEQPWLLPAGLACLVLLAAFPVLQFFQRRLGADTAVQLERFKAIAGLGLGHRVFLVVTAAVVEEFLYRGIAIGLGAAWLGLLPAAALSVAAFTLAHFCWGATHLVSVLWAAVVLTGLFVHTGSLAACVLVHAVVDGIALLAMPALMRRAPAPGDGPGAGLA